ncbi:MAG: beta-carotene 15,15'-monooxygenase [Actinomyces urogenitalis]|uniref:DUF6541 family protein n=1 Tax=Actinomyces urogenitalis TaxID=103621 RepID=UPI00242CFB83|nr:DUF6541 family protein [Actinomyces urogenitalis]MBS5976498.1 beta-carotene 15,15'-monooxygenase [Actinomyces urogenitalis]
MTTALACLTALLLLGGPGALIGRASGLRGAVLAAASLPLSCAVIGLAEITAGYLRLAWLPWGWEVTVVLGVALTALTWGVLRLPAWLRQGKIQLDRPAQTASVGHAVVLDGAAPSWALALAAAAAACLVGAGLLVGGGASGPAQAFDAIFHLSAAQEIRQGGNASSLGGLAALYHGQKVYYPTVWHGVVALLPGTVPQASNALVLILAAVAWPVGVGGLVTAVLGRRQWASVVTMLAAASTVGAPTVLLTTLSVWPYALSVVCLPGVLALVAWARRSAQWGPGLVLVAEAAAGTVLAHGSGAFNLLVLAVPVATTATVRGARRRLRVTAGLVSLALALALALVSGVWAMRAPIASLLGYERPGGSAVGTLAQAVADAPMYGPLAWHGVPTGLVVTALAVIGWRHRRSRAGVVTWTATALTALALVTLVGGPQWGGRQIGSLWYLQKSRVEPLVIIPGLVAAGLGIQVLVARWRDRGRDTRCVAAVLCAGALAMGAARLPLTTGLSQSVHAEDQIAFGTLTTREELAFYDRVADKLPEGAVVVGAPSLGTSYLWSQAGVRVVYPMRSGPEDGTAEDVLAAAEPELVPGSRTCEALTGLGARYYLRVERESAGLRYGNAPLRWDKNLAAWPDDGLRLVDAQTTSRGQVSLWEVTGCDRGQGPQGPQRP